MPITLLQSKSKKQSYKLVAELHERARAELHNQENLFIPENLVIKWPCTGRQHHRETNI